MTSDGAARSDEIEGVPAGGTAAADDRFARQLRGFGPVGLLAILIILAGNAVVIPLSALLVVLWAWRSRTPWSEIGYVRPRSWALTVAGGIVFGTVFKLAMKSVVMPLLGADPVNHAYHFLAGNRAALPAALYAVIIGAGFGEETLFRGYMFQRFGKLLGGAPWAKSLIVMITAAWFGAAHYSAQGLPGVEQATIVGVVFGTIYALTGRIWMLMVAHAAFDVTAVAIIYWDLETKVGQWFFR